MHEAALRAMKQSLTASFRHFFAKKMAERAGFEPAVRFPVRQFSKLLLSATQPPLRFGVRFKSAPPETVYNRDCDYLARRMPSSSVNEMYLARFSRAR